jgi:hypothetical protein
VVITPGIPHTVPQDIPAGFYSARVEGEAVCFAQMAHADGAEQTAVGQPGTNIQFRLFEGSTVITSVGCPQVYLPTAG